MTADRGPKPLTVFSMDLTLAPAPAAHHGCKTLPASAFHHGYSCPAAKALAAVDFRRFHSWMQLKGESTMEYMCLFYAAEDAEMSPNAFQECIEVAQKAHQAGSMRDARVGRPFIGDYGADSRWEAPPYRWTLCRDERGADRLLYVGVQVARRSHRMGGAASAEPLWMRRGSTGSCPRAMT
jgi:hypothetical protein